MKQKSNYTFKLLQMNITKITKIYSIFVIIYYLLGCVPRDDSHL